MSMQNAQGGIPVIILKDGAQQTKGRDAQKNNITAAKLIAEIIHTSLGPRGMDKMLVDSLGDVTITNDGATILKEIDVQHPAAKMLVEIAKATDNEVGDGTTSAVVLAGALLDNAESLILQEVHPTIIVDGYRKAAQKTKELLAKIADKVSPTDKEILEKIAKMNLTTWNYKTQDPKTFRHYGPMAQDFFAAFGKDEMGQFQVPPCNLYGKLPTLR